MEIKMMFKERIKIGKSWEAEVEELLTKRGYLLMKHGYEYTHKEIQEILVKYDKAENTNKAKL